MSSTEEILRAAVAAYQAGRLSEAELGYRRVLRTQPTSHLALYGLALLCFQAGEKEQAIDYVHRSLKFEPNNGLTWNFLGTLYIETDRPVEAKAAFLRATELLPENLESWCNLAHCLLLERNLDGAAQLLRRVLTAPHPPARASEWLADILRRQGRLSEAAQTVAAWQVREPTNPIARHMSAAFSGQGAPIRASDEYVQAHFDAFADGFDSVLRSLDYRGPELVSGALRAAASHRQPIPDPSSDMERPSTPAFACILDAGCGTGLSGPHLREFCQRLVGIDLSPRMLHHAQLRGCYDELATAELGAFMRSRPSAFDAIVCADTLVYFGGLAEPLASAHETLRGDGPLVFTIEALPQNDSADYRLGVSGRYQHSTAYLHRVLNESGFVAESVAQQTLRKDAGRDVPGYVVVVRKDLSRSADDNT
ncbi:MAG TPA: tetratricopeptide repeat protein [Steroidobacteraceae bacterium]|nr:tetratricopeptide repeat protein [Steroidobacteraceae bacterium]